MAIIQSKRLKLLITILKELVLLVGFFIGHVFRVKYPILSILQKFHSLYQILILVELLLEEVFFSLSKKIQIIPSKAFKIKYKQADLFSHLISLTWNDRSLSIWHQIDLEILNKKGSSIKNGDDVFTSKGNSFAFVFQGLQENIWQLSFHLNSYLQNRVCQKKILTRPRHPDCGRVQSPPVWYRWNPCSHIKCFLAEKKENTK